MQKDQHRQGLQPQGHTHGNHQVGVEQRQRPVPESVQFTPRRGREKIMTLKTLTPNLNKAIIASLELTVGSSMNPLGISSQLGSWSEGWIKIQSSLEKPSDKC